MPDDSASSRLLHQDHTVLILRLTFDQQHQLYQGMVIDAEEQVVGRFRTWQELVTLLQRYRLLGPGELRTREDL